MKIITTSWDDGAIEDFKLAEILNKYNLQATFYIPKKNNERQVISSGQIRELASTFEIGGHTLNHVFLTTVSSVIQWQEIEGCFNWLNEIINLPPKSFCAPKGLYSDNILQMVKKAGFTHLRTTHLLNLKGLSPNSILPLMHTTVQMYQHSKYTYFKHLIKRRKFSTLISWLSMHSENELLRLTEKKLESIRINQTGCFHLWGHSWEIEEYQLWNKLEAVCKLLSNQQDFVYMKNNQIII
jgi:hypothetical protein